MPWRVHDKSTRCCTTSGSSVRYVFGSQQLRQHHRVCCNAPSLVLHRLRQNSGSRGWLRCTPQSLLHTHPFGLRADRGYSEEWQSPGQFRWLVRNLPAHLPGRQYVLLMHPRLLRAFTSSGFSSSARAKSSAASSRLRFINAYALARSR